MARDHLIHRDRTANAIRVINTNATHLTISYVTAGGVWTMEHERNTNNGWVWQQMKPFPADYLKERDRILGAAANKEARMETGLRLLEAFSEKTIMGEYSCGETILTKLETDYSKANGQKFYHGTVMGKQRECKACGLKTIVPNGYGTKNIPKGPSHGAIAREEHPQK